jgi:hypothetical protein
VPLGSAQVPPEPELDPDPDPELDPELVPELDPELEPEVDPELELELEPELPEAPSVAASAALPVDEVDEHARPAVTASRDPVTSNR